MSTTKYQQGLDWLLQYPKSRLRAYGHNLHYETKVSAARQRKFEEELRHVTDRDLSDEERTARQSILAGQRRYNEFHVKTRLRDPDTFHSDNAPAAYHGMEDNVLLVRLEMIREALDASHVSFADLQRAMSPLPQHRNPDQLATIRTFVDGWNGWADLRPQFAARYEEVKADTEASDWAERLRTKLGLAHFSPRGSAPLRVALMIYRASDVVRTCARRAGIVHIFTRPTAIDQPPWQHFFPVPTNMEGGRCMPLVSSPARGKLFCEILHPKFDYRPDHLIKVGELTTPAPEEGLKALRNWHLARLRQVSGESDFGGMMEADVDD